MPRPCKRRRVCALPGNRRFGPIDRPARDEPIPMTVDEFETVRLIDLEQLTQEECAKRLGVARTTAQAIYNSARAKLARCLAEGAELQIGGGEYVLCQGPPHSCGCPRCRKQPEEYGGTDKMKLAVTYENGQIFQHFGHTAQFKLYEVKEGKVLSSQLVDAGGSGHGALAGFLKAQGVEALICGGIGGGARTALAQAGIQLFGGVSGSADRAAEDFAAGKLAFDPDVLCSHHGEGHGAGHSCGGHEEGEACGSHGCGGSCHS